MERRTAVVLGGGGITGIACEIGVLAGLAELGVDLSDARLVVGPSAGSVARMRRATLAHFGGAMLRTRGRDQDVRRRVGALAIAAAESGATPTEQERLDVIGSRLVSTIGDRLTPRGRRPARRRRAPSAAPS